MIWRGGDKCTNGQRKRRHLEKNVDRAEKLNEWENNTWRRREVYKDNEGVEER